MAQRQFRSDDTSTWSDRYGSGSDGAYNPSTSTDAPVNAACTGTSGQTTLSATNASFAAGQLILIHQTQGTGAGNWELNKIASYVAGTITLAYPLINTYATGAQVQVMKQYSSASIGAGVTLTASAWNGTTGGIVAFFCNGTTTIAGTISLSGKGFRGGATGTNQGSQGESSLGVGVSSAAANGNGGGGGGYAPGGASAGTGGGTVGVASLTTVFFGGASGGVNGIAGTNGSGFCLIISPTITVTGSINNNGAAGSNGATDQAPTGGGAGGAVLLKGKTITLGTNLVTASGGTNGTGGSTNTRGSGGGGYATSGGTGATSNAGTGGDGRIHIDYASSFSGSTTPTLDSRQDSSLGGSSLPLFFNQL